MTSVFVSAALVSEQGRLLFVQEGAIERSPSAYQQPNASFAHIHRDYPSSIQICQVNISSCAAPLIDQSICKVAASVWGLVSPGQPFSFSALDREYHAVPLPRIPLLLLGTAAPSAPDILMRLMWIRHLMGLLFESDLTALAQRLQERSEDAIHHATFHDSIGQAYASSGQNASAFPEHSLLSDDPEESDWAAKHVFTLFWDAFVQPCISSPDLRLFLMAPLHNWMRRREMDTSLSAGDKNMIYTAKMLLFDDSLVQKETVDMYSSDQQCNYYSDRTEWLLMQLIPQFCRNSRDATPVDSIHLIQMATDVVILINHVSQLHNTFVVFELSPGLVTTDSHIEGTYPKRIQASSISPSFRAAWAAVEHRLLFLFKPPSASEVVDIRHKMSSSIGVIDSLSDDNESLLRDKFSSLARYEAPVDKSIAGYVRPTPPPARPLSADGTTADGLINRKMKAAISRPRPPPHPV